MTVRLGLAPEEKRQEYIDLAHRYREKAKTLRASGQSSVYAESTIVLPMNILIELWISSLTFYEKIQHLNERKADESYP